MKPRERTAVSIESAMEDAHAPMLTSRPVDADPCLLLHDLLLRALGEARMLMGEDPQAEVEMAQMGFEPALRNVIFGTRALYRNRVERRKPAEVTH